MFSGQIVLWVGLGHLQHGSPARSAVFSPSASLCSHTNYKVVRWRKIKGWKKTHEMLIRLQISVGTMHHYVCISSASISKVPKRNVFKNPRSTRSAKNRQASVYLTVFLTFPMVMGFNRTHGSFI